MWIIDDDEGRVKGVLENRIKVENVGTLVWDYGQHDKEIFYVCVI